MPATRFDVFISGTDTRTEQSACFAVPSSLQTATELKVRAGLQSEHAQNKPSPAQNKPSRLRSVVCFRLIIDVGYYS